MWIILVGPVRLLVVFLTAAVERQIYYDCLRRNARVPAFALKNAND